jgi:hypothetical protein
MVGFAMTGLALAAIVGGLWLAGGPGYARKEDNDRARYADLSSLRRALYCADGTAPDTLPESGDAYCKGVFATNADVADPVTKAPYRYARLDDLRYRVCADFETTTPYSTYDRQETNFDLETGCLTASVRRQ